MRRRTDMRDFVVCSLLLRAGFSLAVLPFLLLFLPLAALKKLVGSLVSGIVVPSNTRDQRFESCFISNLLSIVL